MSTVGGPKLDDSFINYSYKNTGLISSKKSSGKMFAVMTDESIKIIDQTAKKATTVKSTALASVAESMNKYLDKARDEGFKDVYSVKDTLRDNVEELNAKIRIWNKEVDDSRFLSAIHSILHGLSESWGLKVNEVAKEKFSETTIEAARGQALERNEQAVDALITEPRYGELSKKLDELNSNAPEDLEELAPGEREEMVKYAKRLSELDRPNDAAKILYQLYFTTKKVTGLSGQGLEDPVLKQNLDDLKNLADCIKSNPNALRGIEKEDADKLIRNLSNLQSELVAFDAIKETDKEIILEALKNLETVYRGIYVGNVRGDALEKLNETIVQVEARSPGYQMVDDQEDT